MTKYAFDLIKFAKDFHGERWGRGETTRSIAVKLGLSASTISRWERAKFEPAIVPFLHACGMLGLNPLDYIGKESEIQRPLPGFEEFTAGEVVPLSQQSLYETLELHGGVGEYEPFEDDDENLRYPTQISMGEDGGAIVEVWSQEIGWVLLPGNMSVKEWYDAYDASRLIQNGRV